MNNITNKIINNIKNLKSSPYSDINTVKFIASGGCWPTLTIDKYYITYDINECNYIVYYNNLLINVVEHDIHNSTCCYIVADNKIVEYNSYTNTLKIIKTDITYQLYDGLNVCIHKGEFLCELFLTDGFELVKYDYCVYTDNNQDIVNFVNYNNFIYKYKIKYIAANKMIKVTLD